MGKTSSIEASDREFKQSTPLSRRTPFLCPDIGKFTISHCGSGSASNKNTTKSHVQSSGKMAKIEILLSPKAALQLKCIFAVYELNLINNFCIVANSLSLPFL